MRIFIYNCRLLVYSGGDVEEISPALHMVNEVRFLEEKKNIK
jgi:hypothetical protein